MLSEKSAPDKKSTSAKQGTSGNPLWQRIGKSFTDSIGDIVFGMEDGTVSIFGLVFGVVSMMAVTFLDVESTNDQAKAQLAHEQTEIETNLAGEKQEVRDRLRTAGFDDQDTTAIVDALARHPKTFLQFEAASELQLGRSEQKNPFVQSAWMFISDLFAASVPVVPFALLPPGDRAPGLAYHHSHTFAAAGCGTGPRGTPQRRADCAGNTGYRNCCRFGRFFDWQTRHSLKRRAELVCHRICLW
jgi:hypothetical protein